MASLWSQCSSFAFTSLFLLLLVSLPPTILSQHQPPVTTPGPTVTDCAPRLLPLSPCAAFVQGAAQSPAQSCCDNLRQLYVEQPGCLCLLLNNTNLSPFPINRTLALQLPALCNIQADISSCSGAPEVPPASPASQVSLGAQTNSSVGRHANSTVAASPVVQVAPRPIMMGLGMRSSAVKLKAEGPLLLLVVTLTAILFI